MYVSERLLLKFRTDASMFGSDMIDSTILGLSIFTIPRPINHF
jgi:hypothetical protein